MQQNTTQTMLLPNQPLIGQFQQNNIQPLLIPNQQPFLQIQPNIIPQNIPQQTIIPNQTPLVQPQINNIQSDNFPNQTPLVQPQLDNIRPAINTPVIQQTQNNQQPENQTQINTNETNMNQIEKDMINELNQSEYATLHYSRNDLRRVFRCCYNCPPPQTFDIYLGKGGEERNTFRCTEVSTSFQRNCVGTSKREFDMDMLYNISDDEYEFTKEPILKIHRIEGGCCSDRGIMVIKYPDDQNFIGIILQANLANIYDSNNDLIYRIKLPFEIEGKTCCQKFLGCCCSCCIKNEQVEEESKDYKRFLIKKIFEKEEQVEDVVLKKKAQEIVGEMVHDYPLKIIFPVDATPKEKILLIVCRIFLLYMMNYSETLRDKWGQNCRKMAEDLIETQDRGILGRINDVQEKISDFQGFWDNLHDATVNKNIISLKDN